MNADDTKCPLSSSSSSSSNSNDSNNKNKKGLAEVRSSEAGEQAIDSLTTTSLETVPTATADAGSADTTLLNASSNVHEIAAKVAAIEQLRATNHHPSSLVSRNTVVGLSSSMMVPSLRSNCQPQHLPLTNPCCVPSQPKKRDQTKLDWKHLKSVNTKNSPYGVTMPNGHDFNTTKRRKPLEITSEECALLAKCNRDLFPVGFYEMTCKNRGVTRGRGEWKNKETLKLVHCGAERLGCKFKVRYCRVATGVEVWTSGVHNYLKHKEPSKRGLNPIVRQFVTEHHEESQSQIMQGLIARGLVSPNDKDHIKKIMQQIKRRKSTVKSNAKLQGSMCLQKKTASSFSSNIRAGESPSFSRSNLLGSHPAAVHGGDESRNSTDSSMNEYDC